MIIEQKDNQKRHVHKSGVFKNQKPAFAVALSVYSIYAYRLIHPIIQVEDKKKLVFGDRAQSPPEQNNTQNTPVQK